MSLLYKKSLKTKDGPFKEKILLLSYLKTLASILLGCSQILNPHLTLIKESKVRIQINSNSNNRIKEI
jgi:hypothetical protein